MRRYGYTAAASVGQVTSARDLADHSPERAEGGLRDGPVRTQLPQPRGVEVVAAAIVAQPRVPVGGRDPEVAPDLGQQLEARRDPACLLRLGHLVGAHAL